MRLRPIGAWRLVSISPVSPEVGLPPKEPARTRSAPEGAAGEPSQLGLANAPFQLRARFVGDDTGQFAAALTSDARLSAGRHLVEKIYDDR